MSNSQDLENAQVRMAPPKRKGLSRLIAAGVNSLQGLKATFRSEEAFRLEVYVLLLSTPFALWLGDGAIEKVMLIGSVLLLLIIELLNTAVESVVDRIGPEFHELSGKAKDIGSAAVLVGMVIVAMTWGLLLLGQ